MNEYKARIEQLAAINEELEAKLSKSEALLAKAVITLKLLADVSVMMQSSTSHDRFKHNTIITDSIWSQWSKQLKYARTILAELSSPTKGQNDD